MLRIFSHPRFLAFYSAVLTVAFALTVAVDFFDCSTHRVFGADLQHSRHPDFDQISVHRINIVEPDGTTRLVISDKAEFPGGFYKGKEFSRAERASAGMLFMNDEGTENGGMLFGGDRSADGNFHSYGHLSFDGYEQDQSLSIDSSQDGDQRYTSYQINDNVGPTLLTPDIGSAMIALRSMPAGPARDKAVAEFHARHPYSLKPRAALERDADQSAVLRLRDPEGRTRILLRVAKDGSSSMQFLDADGKITHAWPDASQK